MVLAKNLAGSVVKGLDAKGINLIQSNGRAANQVIDDDMVGMTFYPDASSTGGYIVLESKTESYEISVIWMTGKIRSRFVSKAA